MISKKLENAINDQIVAELWSSNLYLSMALFLKKEGWNGSANWMFKQADEEKEHALTMADYLIKRGGEARVGKLDELQLTAAQIRSLKFLSDGRASSKFLRLFTTTSATYPNS